MLHTAHLCRFLKQVRPPAWNVSFFRVGVHVRAGDVLWLIWRGHTAPGQSYYIKAANYLTANLTVPVQYIVTSDDLRWTKRRIALEVVFQNRSNVSVVYSEGKDAGFDMALLSSCDALIMSTGSFGWWASWLTNITTIYYRYWPRPGTFVDSLFTREDYFPPWWTGVGDESDLAKEQGGKS